jgi:hypothetical protein
MYCCVSPCVSNLHSSTPQPMTRFPHTTPFSVLWLLVIVTPLRWQQTYTYQIPPSGAPLEPRRYPRESVLPRYCSQQIRRLPPLHLNWSACTSSLAWCSFRLTSVRISHLVKRVQYVETQEDIFSRQSLRNFSFLNKSVPGYIDAN